MRRKWIGNTFRAYSARFVYDTIDVLLLDLCSRFYQVGLLATAYFSGDKKAGTTSTPLL